MASRIELRRDTAANWTAANPVLAFGEPAYESDTRRIKVGDGATAWASLPYAAALPADVTAATTASALDAATATNVASGAATSAALRAAYAAQPFDIFDDFSGKTGAIGGQKALTGQTWTAFANPTGNVVMTVSGGALTDTYAGSTASGGYASAQAANSLTYLTDEFSFTSGAANGNLTLIAFANEVGAFEAAHGGQVPASPCHLVILPNQWIYDVVDSSGTITQLATGNFTAPLTQDGATRYTVEVVIDQAAQTAYLRLPDGTFVIVGPDSRIGQSASWLTVENFYNTAVGSTKARTWTAAASSKPIGHDARSASIRAQAKLLAPPAWTAVTLAAPFTNVSGRPVQVSKDAQGRVHGRGVAQTNGGTSANKLFTLDGPYLPTQDIKVPASVGFSEFSVSLDIRQIGDVYPTSTTDWGFWYFDGVSFATK